MTLSFPAEELRAARAGERAAIGFSIYNLEQGLAVVGAAEAEGVPVLLQAGSSAFGYGGREPLMQLALGLAKSAGVDVGVHLDHSTDIAEVEACLAAGYTSVMFDGSGLPLEENIRLTRAVADAAHERGAWAEGELAGIAGDEDESTGASAEALTDPESAAEFVAATGVDVLAVAIGNVHGVPSKPVELDFELLSRIAAAVDVPLVLHGASGLSDAEVLTAVSLGVAKLNVNTELRQAFRAGLLATAASPPAGDGIAPLLAGAVASSEELAKWKLQTFSSPWPRVAEVSR